MNVPTYGWWAAGLSLAILSAVRLGRRRSSSFRFRRAALFLGALALTAASVWTSPHEVRRSVDLADSPLWIVLDVSRSMSAADCNGSRLEVARAAASAVIEKWADRPVGLIAFADGARILCPPTRDADFLAKVLVQASTESAPPGGSEMESPFSLLKHASGDPAPWAVVVLSDGGELESAPAAVRAAASLGSPVVALGIGDPVKGSQIPIGDGKVLAENGQVVLSRLNEKPLEEIAEETNGVCRRLPAQPREAATQAATLLQRWSAQREASSDRRGPDSLLFAGILASLAWTAMGARS